MPYNHLILCRPLLLLPSIFSSIRVFSNELVLRIKWPSIGVSASASVLPVNIQDMVLIPPTPCDSGGKESACNVGELGLIPGLGRSLWRREWLPTPALLPGEFHGQKRLAGYSPWGHEESDTTEQLTLNTHNPCLRGMCSSWNLVRLRQ